MQIRHTSIFNDTAGTYIMDADIRRAIIAAIDEGTSIITIKSTTVHIQQPIVKDSIRQINIHTSPKEA